MTAVTNIFNKFGGDTFSKIGSSISSAVGSVGTRLSAAGLAKGGGLAASVGSMMPGASNVSFGEKGGDAAPSANDWRVRVSVNPTSGILYWAEGDAGIQAPLKNTDGVIFPYVPSLTVSYSAKYNSQPLTHTNYQNYFYESSEVQAIQLSADFTVQNTDEAEYFLAALYFFRAATKMFYGQSGVFQGSPPPIVYLDGYGAHYLPHVACVITSFSHTMPPDVDYMEVKTQRPGETQKSSNMKSASDVLRQGQQGGITQTGTSSPTSNNNSATVFYNRVPTISQFQIGFQPVYSRARQREFDYGAFAKGDLINKGFL